MDIEQLREAYIAAINEGYSHAKVGRFLEIGDSSLKNFFYGDAGLGDDAALKLSEWLTKRGFLEPVWAKRDRFDGIFEGMKGVVREIESERSADARRNIIISFLERLASHPEFINLQNTSKASKE